MATYSLHHLTDEQKVSFLRSLYDCLKEDGKILIGDVAFETRDKLNQCRQEAGFLLRRHFDLALSLTFKHYFTIMVLVNYQGKE